jgi:hypothetical protein
MSNLTRFSYQHAVIRLKNILNVRNTEKYKKLCIYIVNVYSKYK